MDPKIIYEADSFVVVDKPAGSMVHGIRGKAVDAPILADWIGQHYPETLRVGDDPELRPGMVHRLDRDTSGLMIISRTQDAFDYFKNAFQHREVHKRYLALVVGSVAEERGAIELPIGIRSGTVRHTTRPEHAKDIRPARTRYEVLARLMFNGESLTLLAVFPETGRTHQIRVHLAAVHHPVLGDQLYGGKRQRELASSLGLNRQFLHAAGLRFTAPTGERLELESSLPEDLAQALARVGCDLTHLDLHS